MQGTRVVYITHLTPQSISDEEKQTIAWMSTSLGEDSWKDALIILSDSQTVKPAWKLASVLKRRSDMLRLTIASHVGWDIASSIITIAIDTPKDPLADSQQWLEKYSTLPSTYHVILVGARKVTVLSIAPSQQCSPKQSSALPGYAKTLMFFYLFSMPVSVAGLLFAGLPGYGIALLIIFLLWFVVTIRDALRN